MPKLKESAILIGINLISKVLNVSGVYLILHGKNVAIYSEIVYFISLATYVITPLSYAANIGLVKSSLSADIWILYKNILLKLSHTIEIFLGGILFVLLFGKVAGLIEIDVTYIVLSLFAYTSVLEELQYNFMILKNEYKLIARNHLIKAFSIFVLYFVSSIEGNIFGFILVMSIINICSFWLLGGFSTLAKRYSLSVFISKKEMLVFKTFFMKYIASSLIIVLIESLTFIYILRVVVGLDNNGEFIGFYGVMDKITLLLAFVPRILLKLMFIDYSKDFVNIGIKYERIIRGLILVFFMLCIMYLIFFVNRNFILEFFIIVI